MTTGVFFSTVGVWVSVFDLESADAADDLDPPNLRLMGFGCSDVTFLLELPAAAAASAVEVFSLDIAAGSLVCLLVIVLLDSFSGMPDFSLLDSLVVFLVLCVGIGGIVECECS